MIALSERIPRQRAEYRIRSRAKMLRLMRFTDALATPQRKKPEEGKLIPLSQID